MEAFLAMEAILADKLQVTEEELKATQIDLEAMKRDVESKAKQLEDRDKKLATRDKTSLKLEVSCHHECNGGPFHGFFFVRCGFLCR